MALYASLEMASCLRPWLSNSSADVSLFLWLQRDWNKYSQIFPRPKDVPNDRLNRSTEGSSFTRKQVDPSRSIFHFLNVEYCDQGGRIWYLFNYSFPCDIAQGNEAHGYKDYPKAPYGTNSERSKMLV